MINVSIIGCTGYVGQELLRIALSHEKINITHLISKSFAGQMLSKVYKNYFKDYDKKLEAMDIDLICKDSDVVFTCLPHGTSAEVVLKLFDKGVKVIDLSGDFRYDDVNVYEQWYKTKHNAKELIEKAVYGLSEVYEDKVKTADLVGNPGCYTTCSILPILPLINNKLIDFNNIIIDAKSGVSGAGRNESLALSFSEQHDNFKAYGLATHRHTSEIEQELSKAAGRQIAISFTPHLLPIKRGILATTYCNLKGEVKRQDVIDAYKVYKDKPFINVLNEGLPEIKHVAGSNNLIIGFKIDERLNRIIVVSVIDNLVKGAAGQAIQNMNIMFGLKETEGLNLVGWYL
jgi:N-acetyl-gamma-glutamyl-phosphate reductase